MFKLYHVLFEHLVSIAIHKSKIEKVDHVYLDTKQFVTSTIKYLSILDTSIIWSSQCS